jgi:hypothetical protein
MRDPDCTAPWSDTLSFRVKYQETRTLLTNYDVSTRTTNQAARAALNTNAGFVKNELKLDNSRNECRVMRSTPRSFTALQSLPSTSLLLLLTPVITPVQLDKSAPKSSSTDPFEILGRELSKQHHRLRHVPYVPAVGMTETHAAFIEQAAAVIVVMCEPDGPEGGQSLKQQRSFADDVVIKQLEDLSDEEDDEAKAPFVLIRFDSKTDGRTKDDYKNVLHALALTATSSKEAAQLLFKTEG